MNKCEEYRYFVENCIVMRFVVIKFLPVFFLASFLSGSLAAQTWKFAKEKDGIRLYTGKETGKNMKSYKGITDIHAPAEQVVALIEDVYHTEWWDKNISQIKVLLYEKNKRAQYYIVYDLPWPVTDRDLCVDVTVSVDPSSGETRITAVPLPERVPENPDMIRIKDYKQSWMVKPAGKDVCHVVLEGFVDPSGSIPDWISNMLIVDSPVQIISGVRNRMEKK
jgi:hypothetical protein